jgi:hypothetical protein
MPLGAVILACVAVPLNTTQPAGTTGFEAPPPRMVELLRQKHHASDWLYVTTPSGRYEVRVAGIHEGGLAGLESRKGAPPATNLEWNQVARIEKRNSHFHAGQLVGAVVGAFAGGYGGAAIGNPDHGDAGAWTGLAIGTVAGAWLGGKVGDRYASAEHWYEGNGPGGATIAGDIPNALDEFRKHAKSSDVLRVRGSFGEFTGRASNVDHDGFSGLARDERHDMAFKVPEEPLRWSQIASIERRGNSAGRYAGFGALIGAGVLSVVGATVSAGFNSENEDILGAALAGGAVGGLAGAGVGALIGQGVERWHPVYTAPLIAENTTNR